MTSSAIPEEAATSAIPIISSIAEIGDRYPVWIVDIWGVLHDGVKAFPAAVDALCAFKAKGGKVLLLSNSPRPSPAVRAQLHSLGVLDQAYDATVTSGDLTRRELEKRAGAKVFHIGPERDRTIFAGLDLHLTKAEEAELVVCSGLFDDTTETPETYHDLLADLAERGLTMLCANPDHMVERGGELVYCAGALADVYEDLEGQVIYAGKPYPPVYELAFEQLAEIAGRKVERSEVLAIGDGINTDMAGAAAAGIDSVFIAGGLHASDLITPASHNEMAEAGEDPPLNGDTLSDFFGPNPLPVAAMLKLT
ncbi:TIGR01459 family HAD-type hydrolase [Methyloligella sp. 2.7D]|uniref:TIGR01459 family HAD-type hydrolase n=1 Tax=unclassified Methyloligella TaxID=2625955 RepID=UPI00157CDF85|nr:TIGR01459 family HAD-type hydrolase [Methyloligella sp. GL2]QKP78362.1 TIGR01459 family HAD-type hydrolase [Methyloligella sp. GL2]